MYVVLEYLAWLALVSVFAATLFLATTLMLVTREGAERVAETLREVAMHAAHMVADRSDAGRVPDSGGSGAGR